MFYYSQFCFWQRAEIRSLHHEARLRWNQQRDRDARAQGRVQRSVARIAASLFHS